MVGRSLQIQHSAEDPPVAREREAAVVSHPLSQNSLFDTRAQTCSLRTHARSRKRVHYERAGCGDIGFLAEGRHSRQAVLKSLRIVELRVDHHLARSVDESPSVYGLHRRQSFAEVAGAQELRLGHHTTLSID